MCVLSVERRLSSAAVFNNITGGYVEDWTKLFSEVQKQHEGNGHKFLQRKFLRNFLILGSVSPQKVHKKKVGFSALEILKTWLCKYWACCSNCDARTTLSWGWYQIAFRDPFQPKLLGSSNHIFKIKVQGLFKVKVQFSARKSSC